MQPIIHMTWKTKKLPKRFQKAVNEWSEIGRVIVYDDDDLRNEIPQKYLDFYDSLPKQIFRVDLARYFILYKKGGIYADMDTIPLKSFGPLVSLNKVVLGNEPLEHSTKIYGKDQVICNAIMVSPPRQPFWMDLINYIVDNYDPNRDVVASTGPIAITEMYEKYPQLFRNVVILDSCKLFPLVDLTNPMVTSNGYQSKKQGQFDNVSNQCDLHDAYAVHLWSHEWMTKFNLKWLKKKCKSGMVILLLIIAILVILFMSYYKKR